MEKYDLEKGDKVIFVSIVGPNHFDHSGVFTYNGKYSASDRYGFYYEVSDKGSINGYRAYHEEIIPLKYLAKLERVIYGYEDPVS